MVGHERFMLTFLPRCVQEKNYQSKLNMGVGGTEKRFVKIVIRQKSNSWKILNSSKNVDFLMNYYFDEWPTTRRKHPRWPAT